MAQTSAKLLSGIVVPTVTPLTADGSLDEPGLRRLLKHLVEAKVGGLFVVGTTGEGPALPLATRRRAVEVSCEMAAGKVPVCIAAIETSALSVLETSAHAAQAGADAIAIVPPFYMAQSEDDIVHFAEMMDDRSALPVYLYNVPYPHLPQFSLGTLRRVAQRKRILGLKDSSGNFEQLCAALELYRDRPECSVLVGPERLLAKALRAGVHGGVSGGGNLFPSMYNALYHAALQGDDATLDALQARVLQVEEQFMRTGDPQSSLVRGLKTALGVQGICSPFMVPPFASATDEERAAVAQRLQDWQDVAIKAD